MPISLDPDARVDVVLPTDQAKPPESRPTFVGRFASIKERRAIIQASADVLELKKSDEQIAMLAGALDRIFVGWKHVSDPVTGAPIDFATEDRWLSVCLDAQEMLDLLDAWLAATRLKKEERLGFGLPAPSAGATSAGDAPQAAAAPTPLPPPIIENL